MAGCLGSAEAEAEASALERLKIGSVAVVVAGEGGRTSASAPHVGLPRRRLLGSPPSGRSA